MHAESQLANLMAARPLSRALWPVLAVLLCLAVAVSAFHATYLEMARVWARSATFTHGFVVLPMFAFLVWSMRAELAGLPVKPYWPALTGAVAIAFVWLLGELSSSLTPSFFAAVLAVPVVVAAALGLSWVRALQFPLLCLLFAVPFGEVFVPTLISWTADFTVWALRATGVPVFREGQNLVVPNGQWSVVEACSGVRYLLASLFAGVLFAWHMFRSPWRRAAFIALSIAVPIVANWLRAFGIVLLGYLSDNRIAAGVDHLLYGWVFFGIVIASMFLVGARWREDVLKPAAMPAASVRLGDYSATPGRPYAAALAAAGLVFGLAPLLADHLLSMPDPGAAPPLVVAPAAGWAASNELPTQWKPHLVGPRAEQRLAFRRAGDAVGVFVGFYRNQRQGAELVNSVNALVAVEDRAAVVIDQGTQEVALGGRKQTVRTARVKVNGEVVVAWQWYWLDDAVTISDAWAKLSLALDRLRGADDTSAWITVYAVERDGASAARTLAAFGTDVGGALQDGLAQARVQWR